MFRLAGRLTPSRGVVLPAARFIRAASTAPANANERRTPAEPPTAIAEATATPVDVREQAPISDEALQKNQAPNRALTWSRSQRPRGEAMVGPRFEQTDLSTQPRPMAAIELIHEQPVRFIPGRVAMCDGGGGPLGHPKIYINVDKPEIVPCGYCGLPYANTHNKEVIVQSNPAYPIID